MRDEDAGRLVSLLDRLEDLVGDADVDVDAPIEDADRGTAVPRPEAVAGPAIPDLR